MAPGVSTTTELNSLYNLIYEDSLVSLREDNIMVANGLVTIFNGEGYAARKIGEFNKATVQTKPEGQDYAGATKFEKTLAATLTPAVKMSQFLLTDEMISTESTDNIVDRARGELASAIAEEVDVSLMSNFSGFSAGKGTAGSALSYGHVAAAMAVLRNNKVKGMRTVDLHPYQWQDVWVELGKPAANYTFLGETASEALRNYYVSNLEGAMWFISANVPTSGTDATGATFTKEAIGYDEREAFAIEVERDASRKAYEYNASVGYGHGEIRDEAGVRIVSDITEPT